MGTATAGGGSLRERQPAGAGGVHQEEHASPIEERDFDESGYRHRPVTADGQRKRKLRGWIHNALRPEGPRDRDVLVVSVIDDVAIEDPIKVEMTPIGIDNGVPPLLFSYQGRPGSG